MPTSTDKPGRAYITLRTPDRGPYGRARTAPHASRLLARAWLYFISHCWQISGAYDPATTEFAMLQNNRGLRGRS